MNPLSGLNCGINGSYKLGEIKKEYRDHIGDIEIGNLLAPKNDPDGPPKSIAVAKQERNLRQQRLGTVPANKIGALSVTHIKDKGGQKINDGQGQACDYRDERHEIAV